MDNILVNGNLPSKLTLRVALSLVGALVTGGAGWILGYYAGFFSVFGHEAMQFFSIFDLKNDAATEMLLYAPLFTLILGLLCLVYIVTFQRYRIETYLGFASIAGLVCVILKCIVILPDQFDFGDFWRKGSGALFQFLGTFEGKMVAGSGALAITLIVIIFISTNGVRAAVFKYSVVYCIMIILVFLFGYGRALVLALEAPDSKVILVTGTPIEVQILLAGTSGVLVYTASESAVRYIPYQGLAAIELPRQSKLDLYRRRFNRFVARLRS